jgi:hypothetical protein
LLPSSGLSVEAVCYVQRYNPVDEHYFIVVRSSMPINYFNKNVADVSEVSILFNQWKLLISASLTIFGGEMCHEQKVWNVISLVCVVLSTHLRV